jgi:hypothetical protein
MFVHRRALCGFTLALASAGAGCSVSVAPIEVAAGCPERPARASGQLETTAESDLIDDFEHEGASLPRRGGRDGTWASASDGSAEELEASVSDHCAARGERAGHFVASGLSGWGATWTALLRNPVGGMSVHDASTHGGVSFWAALGAQVPAPFSVPVGVTNPAPNAASNEVNCPGCLNYYSKAISLDHQWRRFELRFRDLVQLSNGNPMVPLRLDQLVGLTFWPEGDIDFDIWVDDLRFEP